MSGPLQLVLEMEVKPDNWNDLERTVTELGSDVEGHEPGTLHYQTFTDKANGKVWFSDIYATSEAFVQHFNRPSVQTHLQSIMGWCDVRNVLVLGETSPDAKKILDGFGATYGTPWAGFSRIKVPAVVTPTS